MTEESGRLVSRRRCSRTTSAWAPHPSSLELLRATYLYDVSQTVLLRRHRPPKMALIRFEEGDLYGVTRRVPAESLRLRLGQYPPVPLPQQTVKACLRIAKQGY